MFFYYLVILTNVNTFSVFSTSFLTDDFTDSQDWIITQLKSSNTYTDCNGIRLFGGFETFGNRTLISKFYQLPPHSVVRVSYQFWKIDNWKNEDFYALLIDGEQQQRGSYDEIDGEQLCGNSENDVISDVEVIYQHHYETLQITFAKNARYTDLTNQGYWGIRNFQLEIEPCPPGCLFCDESDDREQCIKWALVYDSLSETIPELFNDDGWYVSGDVQTTSSCQGIPILCGYGLCAKNTFIKKELNLPPHYSLKIQLKFFQIDSWDTETATLIIDDQVLWQRLLAFPTSLRYVSFCGWANFLEVFKNIELDLPHSQDNIEFLFKTNLDQDALDESFGIRDFKIYTLCQFGDSFNQQCSQICGDKVIQSTEVCDDGNMIPFDGCHNCQYSCIEGCSNCIKGLCFECNDPWIYDMESQNCKLECEYCDECTQGICLKCKETFSLINNKCYSICGDGIVTPEFEQCDDGNIIPQDGCYECQFQCRSNCQDCQNGICYDKCPHGQYFINDQCQSKCGDQIVALLEQCDDGNEISNDGCFNCQYSCPINCQICFQGGCVQCQDNLYYDDTLKQCQSICGDGIITSLTEQCDDNNQISNDGCSENCMVEKDWICFETGECLYSKYPEFQVTYLFNKNQYQYVSITFSQPVKRLNDQNNYLNTINATLINSESIPNNITIISVIEATNEELRNVEYAVQILIDCQLNSPPYLQIQLLEILYNENNAPLNNQYQIIQLQVPNYLTEFEKQVAQDMLEYSQKQMFALGAIGCFLLLTGSSMTFWVTLEILQEMSYLKYINVLFPENLMIFFDSSDLISLKPIYQFVELNFQDVPFVYKYKYFTAQEKLEFYQVNANFLYNVRSLVLNYIILFFTYICAVQFYKSMSNLQARRYCDKNQLISKYIMIIKYHSIKMKYQLEKYGIERLFYANSWDFFFMIFLQFHAKELQKMAINKAAALLTFFFCFYYILQQLKSRNKYQKLKKYEIRKDNLMLIIKKLWFMQILISYQEEEILQVILLCINNSVYLSYLLTKNEKCLQEISQQVIILVCILSSSVYWKESIFSFSYQCKIIVGWIQITMMITVILLVSVVDLIESVRSILKIVSMKQQPVQTAQTQTAQIELQQNRPIKFIICNNV